jgi:ubiquitin carboxyl-terminal hydrolase 1
LKVIQEALDEEDFSEATLSSKCHIPARNRVSSTKSRQAVIARAPKSLVIHMNRSVFDERTGVLRKNYADVRFPKILDLDEWCLGTRPANEAVENWGIDPAESMIPRPGTSLEALNRRYELRAVITHYGRHENGHYICYRKYSVESFPAPVPEAVVAADGSKRKSERWFRLSDEDVRMVSESNVLSQGGVFMLFYECIEQSPSSIGGVDGVAVEGSELDQNQPLGDELTVIDVSTANKDLVPPSVFQDSNIGEMGNLKASSAPFLPPANDVAVSSPAADTCDIPFSGSLSEDVSLSENVQYVTPPMQTSTPPDQNGKEAHICGEMSVYSPALVAPI